MEEAKKMRPREYIKIRGANEHNLKNINVDIPRNELVVLTGMSGSGKSSLAFDTIYAEGQRRYMESLSSYARQFLGQMEKPNVESIEGLSPACLLYTSSPNGKATDSDSVISRFESLYPCEAGGDLRMRTSVEKSAEVFGAWKYL